MSLDYIVAFGNFKDVYVYYRTEMPELLGLDPNLTPTQASVKMRQHVRKMADKNDFTYFSNTSNLVLILSEQGEGPATILRSRPIGPNTPIAGLKIQYKGSDYTLIYKVEGGQNE